MTYDFLLPCTYHRNQLRGASKPAFVRIRYSLSPMLYSVKIKVSYATTGTKSAKSLWFICSPQFRSISSRALKNSSTNSLRRLIINSRRNSLASIFRTQGSLYYDLIHHVISFDLAMNSDIAENFFYIYTIFFFQHQSNLPNSVAIYQYSCNTSMIPVPHIPWKKEIRSNITGMC